MLTAAVLRRCAAVATYSNTAKRAAIGAMGRSDRVFVAANSLDTVLLGSAEREWREDGRHLRSFAAANRLTGARIALFWPDDER